MNRITFDVRCPRDSGASYKMTILIKQRSDGSYLPLPCTGCDFMNGLPECTYCIEGIFKMSLKDPTMKSYSEPIIPHTLTE
ncbi:MAG: hypothetical protein U0L73_02590 [Ruminococcus bromii]|nr:hypothetical protein [Ruminococcus bromii]